MRFNQEAVVYDLVHHGDNYTGSWRRRGELLPSGLQCCPPTGAFPWAVVSIKQRARVTIAQCRECKRVFWVRGEVEDG